MLVWVLPLGRIAPGNLRSGSLQRVAINAELDGNIGSLAIGVVGEDELLKIGESATFCLSMWGRAVSLRRRSEARALSYSPSSPFSMSGVCCSFFGRVLAFALALTFAAGFG